MKYYDDEGEDFFLVTHISRALPEQGVAPVKSLTDTPLIDFLAVKDGTKREGETGGRAAALLKRVHSHTVKMQALMKANPNLSQTELIETFKRQELARQQGVISISKNTDRANEGA